MATTPPIINGQTFAQASAGVTDKTQLGNLAQQYQQVAVPPTNISSIPSASLKPASPLTIVPVTNNSAQNSLGAIVNTATQPENTQIIEPPAPVEQPQQNERTGLLSKIKELTGMQSTQGEKTTSLQNEVGLSDKQIAVNDINKKIMTTKRGYEEKIKEIQKNKEGKFGGAVSQDVENLTRIANEDLANLAIIQASANGDLQTAQDIIDSKIKAEFEPIDNQIKQLTQLYQLTQNDMTESEKMQAQANIQEKQQAAQDIMNAKKDAYSTALAANAPASVLAKIGAAKTTDEAYNAVSGYGLSAVDRAQLDNINSQIADRNATNTEGVVTPQVALDTAQNQIDTVSSILGNTKGLSGSVGPTGLSRQSALINTAARQDFVASVQQLTSQLTLDNLITAKARGATFGALSEGELNILAGGATKLNTWAIKDKNGNITGFRVGEKQFKQELDKINNFAKKDYILKGGDPTAVGAQRMPDGTVWTTNSDGTLTLIQ